MTIQRWQGHGTIVGNTKLNKTCKLAISVLDIDIKENKNTFMQNTSNGVFIIILFIIIKHWKNPSIYSAREWIKMLEYSYNIMQQ